MDISELDDEFQQGLEICNAPRMRFGVGAAEALSPIARIPLRNMGHIANRSTRTNQFSTDPEKPITLFRL